MANNVASRDSRSTIIPLPGLELRAGLSLYVLAHRAQFSGNRVLHD